MREATEPVRYHSVSLDGIEKLVAFATRMEAMDRPPLIRHLFIADMYVRALRTSSDEFPENSKAEQLGRRIAAARRSAALLNGAVHTIISCAAPTLYSLATPGRTLDPIADTVFPHLRDLTIGTVLQKPAAGFQPRFPSLRRLHVLCPRASLKFWTTLASSAPDIVHLRLSEMSQDFDIARFLRVFLDVSPPVSEQPSWDAYSANYFFRDGTPEALEAVAVAAQLPALQYITVQPTKYVHRGGCGTGMHIQKQMMHGLNLVQGLACSAAARGEDTARSFVLLPEQQYSLDAARRDWLDTVEGGEDPWQDRSVADASGTETAGVYRSGFVSDSSDDDE
ncbi:hypothetical protein PsYK624_145420 [Phanerochaete sordida]|uniref:Uncharacterized protein n=1 Tax=Phanerochaete sordida TaxID=48140 RepID=A0A9P3GMV8_9APHY|nr:hypothetical protein PsYK624_145420 [Phanerochaete sordida]